MKRFVLTIVAASSLAVMLGGCANVTDFSIDPSEWFAGDIFGNKKKLPGERKPVFPEGVPGVTRGVPPELMKGNQELANDPQGGLGNDQAAVQEEPKPQQPKAKPKPKPKVAAKPAPQQSETEQRPTPVTVRRSDSPPATQQQPSGGQWPEPPAPRQQPSSSGSQWPDPPPARSAPSSGVQWPDPPAR